ncbi:hypothetical protein HOLleu_14497 [Holothuria leucospilota]|uniref:Uncharacterized protein n=1 Tax=Holothuria leucospilota TaxID=206669 RepID=A0A9Q1HCI8_HOLLE|nr:hypothetical protein HOLleu_14497 [Holothuria leucospilota]
MALDCISDLITKHAPIRCLGSLSEIFLAHPPISMAMFYGNRSFTVAAPEVWNSLPANVHSLINLNNLKKYLKTYIFNCLNWTLLLYFMLFCSLNYCVSSFRFYLFSFGVLRKLFVLFKLFILCKPFHCTVL